MSADPIVVLCGKYSRNCALGVTSKKGVENADVRAGRSNDAAVEIVDDLVVEPEAWGESAEATA